MAILHAHVLKTNKVKKFLSATVPLAFSITNNNPATKRHNIFAEGRILGYFFYDKEAIS